MIPDSNIGQIVREKVGYDLQLQSKDLVRESPRSLVYRYAFSNQDLVTRSIILKYFQEQTTEAIVYTYFHTRSMFTELIVHCGVHNDHTYILMHDISKTHHSLSDWQAPIAEEQREKLVQHIAHFHARNWQDYTNLVQCVGVPWHLQSESNYQQYLNYLRRDFNEFRKNPPFPMTATHLDYYDEALIYLRHSVAFLFECLHENCIFTFIHGDLNVCNVYAPDAQNDTYVILDYEALRVGLFSDDLVMLWIHELYHGAPVTKQIFDHYYRCLPDDIKKYLSPELYVRSMQHSIIDGMFFPFKLFTHYGLIDQARTMNWIDAYERLVCLPGAKV
ncbi:MAG: hypothetical protein ACYCZF_10240 [Anaerolineae bacterium]